MKKIRTLFFIIILLIILIIIYGKYLGSKGLLLNEYIIYNEKINDSFNDIKISHFGDINYSNKNDLDFFDSLVLKINSKKTDIIIFTGGLLNKNHKLKKDESNKIIEKLSELNAKYGKYYVPSVDDIKNNNFEEIMNKSGFISLNENFKYIINESNNKILLIGFNKDSKIDFIKENVEKNNDIFKIAIFHESDNIEKIKNYNFDMALSSNSIGNQINIPLINNIFTDNNSKHYKNNYYKINNTDFYITNGIGFWVNLSFIK